MKKHWRSLALAGAFCTMAMTLPQCPGQEELAPEVKTLKTENAELRVKLTELENKMTVLSTKVDKFDADLQVQVNYNKNLADVLTAHANAIMQFVKASPKPATAKASAPVTPKHPINPPSRSQ